MSTAVTSPASSFRNGPWLWDQTANQWTWAPEPGVFYPEVAGAQAAAGATRAGGAAAARAGDLAGTWLRAAKLHLLRAFQVTRTGGALPAEREALAAAEHPVTAPELQDFMAWRRSVIVIAAALMAPLAAYETYNSLSTIDDVPGPLKLVAIVLLGATIAFAAGLWRARGLWTSWQRSRQLVVRAWALYFLAPFVVFLLPLRAFYPTHTQDQAGVAWGVGALIVLLPRVISLMPGLLRASVVSKLAVPGVSAPGWLLLIGTPLYGLLMYVVLSVPYQVTGSAWLLLAMAAFVCAPAFLWQAGRKLAQPLGGAETIDVIRRVRAGYLSLNLAGMVFLAIALGDLLRQIHIEWHQLVHSGATLLTGVLVLGLIGTDGILHALDRAQRAPATAEGEAHRAESVARLTALRGH